MAIISLFQIYVYTSKLNSEDDGDNFCIAVIYVVPTTVLAIFYKISKKKQEAANCLGFTYFLSFTVSIFVVYIFDLVPYEN